MLDMLRHLAERVFVFMSFVLNVYVLKEVITGKQEVHFFMMFPVFAAQVSVLLFQGPWFATRLGVATD